MLLKAYLAKNIKSPSSSVHKEIREVEMHIKVRKSDN
jgi:hypothetical protein